MNIEIAARMLQALGTPTRLRIFHLLAQSGEEGMPVGDLVSMIGVPGSTLSHHVSKLTKVGLVRQERRGTTLVCRADQRAIAALSTYLVERHSEPKL